MKFIEKIIEQYYVYSDVVLACAVTLFFSFILVELFRHRENIKSVINKQLHIFCYSVICTVFGIIICLLGLITDKLIVYRHFNVMIFIMILILVLLGGIVQIRVYKKIVLPTIQICRHISYVIYFQLILLAATGNLEWLEWLAGFAAIICCDSVIRRLEEILAIKKEVIAKEYDYPNPDIYYSRKKQLDKFVEVLKQQKNEPYAIMVSGGWGTGKSSFVLALEERLTEDTFIWILAGSEIYLPENKDNVWVKDTSITRKNLLSLLKPPTN